MAFMMTSSDEEKSELCQFFYQGLFHIVNSVCIQNFMYIYIYIYLYIYIYIYIYVYNKQHK